ncbi:hypothetical protein ABEG18_12970 [Alsobacter sp. KACC 23698]|uniref:Phage tail protein n=1 Tax=Alsobacter sp. KACC 23698 TaxID=3149229 RepID=A0AAU7JMI3_9HYPH
MANIFTPVWAVDGEIETPSEAEIRKGFACGPARPGVFNWLFQTLESTINALNLGDMASKFRQIATTEGIQGGGDLEADRTLRLDISGLQEATDIANEDLVVIFDADVGSHRKMTRQNFAAGLGGDGGPIGGANIGTGNGSVFASLSGSTLQFRKIKDGGGLGVSTVSNDVVIAIADMGAELSVE